jgi:PAS domain S-box-containing protein
MAEKQGAKEKSGGEPTGSGRKVADDRDVVIARLHERIAALETELRGTCEELQTRQEDLEVQAEELEAQNEELRTYNEEMERSTRILQEREFELSKLAAIVTSSGDAIIGKTLDGTITSWNAGAERMYGYSAAEAVGASIDIIVPPARSGELRDILAEIGRGRRVDHFATQRVTKDGRLIETSITISPIADPAGRLIGASTIARDITAAKKAENALKKSRFIMAKSQEMAQVGNWAWNVQTGEMNGSDETYRIYGYQPHEVRPTENWVMGCVHTDDRAIMGEFMIAVCRDGRRRSIDYRIVKPDGATRFLTTVADRVVRDEAGKVRWVYGITQDITGRKQVEIALQDKMEEVEVQAEELESQNEELRANYEELHMVTQSLEESEVRFRSLIQNSSDIIRIIDRNGRIVYDSPSSEKILGYPSGFTIGKSPLDFIHPGDLERVRSELGTVFSKTNPGTPSEFRIRKADGSYLDVESVGVNMIGTPGVNGIVTTTRPITERKRAEEALKEAKTQAELYLDLMSHDISNMHQIALSQLELAEEIIRAEGKISVEDAEMISTPIETLQRSANLIDNVRKLQKLRAGE